MQYDEEMGEKCPEKGKIAVGMVGSNNGVYNVRNYEKQKNGDLRPLTSAEVSQKLGMAMSHFSVTKEGMQNGQKLDSKAVSEMLMNKTISYGR